MKPSCIWVNNGSDNGLLPFRHQAIIWIIADVLSMGPLGTNIHGIWIKLPKFSQENAFEYVWLTTVSLQKVSHWVTGWNQHHIEKKWELSHLFYNPDVYENISHCLRRVGWGWICIHIWIIMWAFIPGPWFNMKMSSYQYRKFPCVDKMVSHKTVLSP